eukprot:jgi/Ulvmu1/11470/UM077_0014.1
MGHARSSVGHRAKLLRTVLQERISFTKGQQQSRIIRAIGLCDAFLNSCTTSTAGLAVLEREVTKALRVKAKQDPRLLAVKPGTADSNGTCKTSNSANTCQVSSVLDCTMPADLRLERKAFTKPIGFAQVAKLQDEIAKRDDVQRAANKASFQSRTRQLLDGQMQELAAQREAEARERQQASRRLAEDINQYKREQHEQQVAKRCKQAAIREQLQAQVHETQQRRDEALAQAARASHLERQRLEQEARQEEAALRQKRVDDADKNQAFVRQMMQALENKRVEAESAKAAERRYNQEFIKRMDAEEAARDAAVAERKAKLEEAFRRGGGEALSASLAEQARADAARAAEQQAAHEAQQLAKEQERQRQREARTQQQTTMLKVQMEEKQRRIADDRHEAAAYGAKLRADAEAMKQQGKVKKAADRVQKAEQLHHLKQLYLEEQKRRYNHARDAIPEDHAWLHKKVAAGDARGFITLPSVYPSV